MRPALAALCAVVLAAACGPAPRGRQSPAPDPVVEEDAGAIDTGPPRREDVPGPPPRYPGIMVSPHRVTLPPTRPGEQTTAEVTVVNEGDGDLILEAIELSSDRPSELVLVNSMGDLIPGNAYRCPCGPFSTRMHQKILIRYRPTEREPVSGHLTIRSNDSTHPLVRIPIASTVPAPELSVSPGDLEFEPLDPEGGGGCDFDRINRQTFQVRNSGSDDLFVTGWELDPPEAEEAFEVCATGKWGLDLAYAPSQERAWRVVFWPPYPGTYQAAVHLESTGGVARVQLSATDAREPHLAVSPALLAWPLLAPGESEGQTLVLSNDGSFPTTVRSFAIEPAEAADAYAIVSDALAPEGTGLAEPIPIGGRVEVEVVHTAAAEPVEATLRIEHDAVDQESPVAVLLRGTSPIPMVEAEPPALTFAAPPPGEPVTKHLRVVNPGGEPVQVWSVSVGAAPGAPEEPLPAFTIDPPDLEGTLEPGTGRLFAVTYTRPAQDAQDETACLVVTGDDPRRNEPLCALLSALQSPEGTPPTAAIEVIPDVTVPLGTELTFDATTSSDPDAGDGITAWRWLLLARPPGGAVGLVGEGPTVTLTPDTLGAWTVALEVTDGTGLPSDETLLAVDVVEPL